MGYMRKTIQKDALLELIRKRMHGVRREADCSDCLPIGIIERTPVDGTSNWLPSLGPTTCSAGCTKHLSALLMRLSDEYDVLFG
ncbi:MAG: hypothetical protein JWR07_4069 [Nevskia sp.]|nr:hypothetical protein [Nevskia sp.]